ncbi:MAG: hypothetical protein JHC87_08425, partial [Thermoleophilaceae bacterium]|nr:hypothetical protein [Thermoleophilaceae bacterium]
MLRHIGPLVAAVACLLVAVQPAAATVDPATLYNVSACNPDGGEIVLGGYQWAPSQPAAISITNNCPRGFEVELDPATALNARATLNYWSDLAPGSTIEQLTMTVEHGASFGGVEYSVATCDDCAPFYMLRIPVGSSGSDTFVVPVASTHSLSIQATCKRASCGTAAGVRISRLEVLLKDDQPPVGQLAIDPSQDWARSGDLFVQAGVRDEGVGVASAALAVDGQLPQWSEEKICHPDGITGWSSARICDGELAYSAPIDTRGLENGVHTVTFAAKDALGNQMTSMTAGFKLDNTNPALPIVTAIDGPSSFGWIVQRQVEIQLALPSNMTGSANESPINTVMLDLRPLEFGASDPPPIQLHAITTSGVINLPTDGQWVADIWNVDSAGNRSSVLSVQLKRDRDPPPEPLPAENPWLSVHDLLTGYEQQ